MKLKLFNVLITKETTLVVLAEDKDHAWEVAQTNVERSFTDSDCVADVFVSGEVRGSKDLRDGWNGDCVPYGGDGNTRIASLLPVA